MSTTSSVKDVSRFANKVLEGLKGVIVGLDEELELVLTALLADGHVLLEGVPGVAKTTMVRALVRLLGLERFNEENFVLDGAPFRGWSRIQFTPDLMPSDIVGTLVFNPVTREFEPKFGPVFAYMVLADEINRAVPRVQSALLQAMQEREVTIGERIYRLVDRSRGKFFFVLATQNPIEQEGTYPLPEAQLDRFLMRVIIPYPKTLEDEKKILRLHAKRLSEPLEDLSPVIDDPAEVVRVQNWIAENVEVDEAALEFIVQVVRGTRPEVNRDIREYVLCGVSPRAGVALLRAAKAYAAIKGEDRVTPLIVEKVAFPVLNHRLILNPERVVERKVETGSYLAQYEVAREALEQVLERGREAVQ